MVNSLIQTRKSAREMGEHWEALFSDIIVPLGFSAGQDSGGLTDDRIIWSPRGSQIYVSVKHKDSYFVNKELRHCYGYERYRLEIDSRIRSERNIPALFVIHDYTHFGRDSEYNRLSDWYAQWFYWLETNIDIEQPGPTWHFGEEKQIVPICYWQLPKFPPLDSVLSDFLSWEEQQIKQGEPAGKQA